MNVSTIVALNCNQPIFVDGIGNVFLPNGTLKINFPTYSFTSATSGKLYDLVVGGTFGRHILSFEIDGKSVSNSEFQELAMEEDVAFPVSFIKIAGCDPKILAERNAATVIKGFGTLVEQSTQDRNFECLCAEIVSGGLCAEMAKIVESVSSDGEYWEQFGGDVPRPLYADLERK
jgi:hypothetical protein